MLSLASNTRITAYRPAGGVALEFVLAFSPAPHRPPFVLPFEVLSSKTLEGDWFRVEVQLQDVTGHREFDVERPVHLVSLTPDGVPTRVVCRIDGEELEPFLVRPGHVTVVPMGERVSGFLDGAGTRTEVHLALKEDFFNRATDEGGDSSRIHFVHSMDLQNPAILQAMASLAHEVERPGPMGRVYADSLVIVILTELVRRATAALPAQRQTEALPPRLVRRIVEYIDVHLGENLALKTLAEVVAMAPARFAREFRLAMGLPAHRYLLHRRVECAAGLLASTKQSIADVALAIGFSSQAHLTSAFQRVYGTTPAVYRRDRT